MQTSHFEASKHEEIESDQNEDGKIKLENQIQSSYNGEYHSSFYMYLPYFKSLSKIFYLLLIAFSSLIFCISWLAC